MKKNKKLIKIYEDYTDRLNSDVWSSVKTDLFEPKEQFRDKNYFSRMTKKEFIEYLDRVLQFAAEQGVSIDGRDQNYGSG